MQTEPAPKSLSDCTSCGAKKLLRGVIGLSKSAMGIGLTTPEETEERLDVCRQCEFATPCKKYPGKKCKCSHCGCHLFHKARLKSEACPVGKWTSSK